jgi:glycosyltransferase involved in cell wall biosynthesis
MTVSVIIPARDAKHTISETLASVAAQTHKPAEVIVVDDGSTDGTGEVARNHAIVSTVVLGEGVGPAAASNLAVSQASSDWIAPLDADDLWAPDRLARSLELAERSGAHVILGMVESFLDPKLAPEVAARIHYHPDQHVGLLGGALFLRRDVFLALGGYNKALKTGYFIDFWDRLTRAGHPVVQGDFIALRRRIRAGSLSHRSGPGRTVIERDFLAVARDAIRRRKSTSQ